MKPLYSILAAAMLFGAAVPLTQAATQISVDFFHDNLESYGDWREVGDYGYCWQPRDVDRDWRPYSDGHWVYTDAGWTWDSEEPYGWAVYHYGRWARVDRVGWVWVPGTEWGPAWVSWRRSARHVGWAPLPPDATFSRSAGFSSRVDADYDIGPTNYSFVEVRNFGAPRLRTVMVEPRENITIIRETTNITRITYVNNVVYNEGPQYDVISRESAQPIRRLRLERREDFGGDPRTVRAEQLRSSVEGESLRVVAPSFNTSPATAPRKVAARVEKVEVDHGWKNAGPPAEVAKLRTKIKSEPAAPAQPSPQPSAVKTAEAPALTPAPSLAPEPKPTKGKMSNEAQPSKPAAAVATEAPPAPAEKPVALEKPVKSSETAKGAKPPKPEAGSPRPSASAAEAAAPPSPLKTGKGKGGETPRLPAEAPSVDKPVASEQTPNAVKPGKLEKAAKPGNPEASRPLPSSPAAETTEQPQPKKGKNKGSEVRPPAEAAPQAQAPLRKRETVEPAGNGAPAAIETPRQKVRPGKEEPQPKPEQPAARTIERNVPKAPEPRPEAQRPEPRQQAAPAAPQTEPPQPGKAKGKGKEKDEKKDPAKPEGANQ